MLLGFCLSACGDDEPSYASGCTAYVGGKTIDGTYVRFYVASNPQSNRCRLQLTYAGNNQDKVFYEDLSQVGATVTVYNNGSAIFITRDSASQLTLVGDNYTVILNEVNGNQFWQNEYDEAEALCIKYYDEYINKSVRYPDLSLLYAQERQNYMVKVHNWAESDGFHINVSSWETKQL